MINYMTDMTPARESSQVMNFLCSSNYACSTISKEAVNYWLENYNDTLFVKGHLRKIVFTSITPEMYNVKTEELK